VLNAFRHHRNSHTKRLKPATPVPLRAQRLSASSEFSLICFAQDAIHFDGCSTPFGIIGILTSSPGIGTLYRGVLNAFRHHRNSHSQRPADAEVLRSVLNAFRHHRNSHSNRTSSWRRRLISAQRLSASSEFSLGHQIETDSNPHVLNAFRHHRNSHTEGQSVSSRGRRCSTPFGIIGILTLHCQADRFE